MPLRFKKVFSDQHVQADGKTREEYVEALPGAVEVAEAEAVARHNVLQLMLQLHEKDHEANAHHERESSDNNRKFWSRRGMRRDAPRERGALLYTASCAMRFRWGCCVLGVREGHTRLKNLTLAQRPIRIYVYVYVS